MRLAAVALLLVACSAQPAASASPSPWSCRLAVIEGSTGQGSGPQTPGFLSLPGSSFSPAMDAGDGMYYDRPLKRWVPAGPPALSDDGLHFAYTDGDTNSNRVHVVDLQTNRDTVLANGGPWRIAGVRSDAVYMMRIEYLPFSEAYGQLVASRGLWKVPLDGGTPAELTSGTRDWVVAGGAAWGGGSTTDVAGGPNDIVRLDVETLKLTTWFVPGARSRVMAVDAGGVPLIMTEAADEELWRVPAPDAAVEVWSGPIGGPMPAYPVAVDGRDVWLSGGNPTGSWIIYRYSMAAGMEVEATFSDHPFTVAGPCA